MNKIKIIWLAGVRVPFAGAPNLWTAIRLSLYGTFVLTLAALGGCASIGPASVAGGECKIFRDPGFAVRGKRLQDARWIGQTQEVGISVCKWKRPTK